MASAEFGANAGEMRPTVPIGEPFTENRLIDAIHDSKQTDAIVAILARGSGAPTAAVDASRPGAGHRCRRPARARPARLLAPPDGLSRPCLEALDLGAVRSSRARQHGVFFFKQKTAYEIHS